MPHPVLVSSTMNGISLFAAISRVIHERVRCVTSESLIEIRSSELVLELGYWLDDNCRYIFLSISSVSDNLPDSIKTPVLFSPVFVLVDSHWVSNLWERSSWPVRSRTCQNSGVTALKSFSLIAIESVVEAEHAKTGGIFHFMYLCILHHCHSQCIFVRLRS